MSDLSVYDTEGRALLVLDTSALITDPSAPDAFVDTDIVVPLVVIEELDNLKSRTDETGSSARKALANIEELRCGAEGSLVHPVEIVNGSTFVIEPNGVHLDSVREVGLDPRKHDNRLLAAALGRQNIEGRKVTVVSNDTALRIKADQLGLAAVEHRRNSADTSPAGWATVEVACELIDELYREGSVGIGDTLEVSGAGAVPGEFAVLRSGPSASALAHITHNGCYQLLREPNPVWDLRPRSKEQRMALALLEDPSIDVVALEGAAGTGKTIMALAAGLEQVVHNNNYARVAVFRPVVPVGDSQLGYLPGTLEEKLDPWFAAVLDTLTALSDGCSEDAAQSSLDELVRTRRLTQETVGHLRGRTLVNTFVLVDEAQNLEPLTLKTILTRLGEGSKVVFTGDTTQIDQPYLTRRSNALAVLRERFRGQRCYGGLRLTSVERSHVAELAGQLL